MQQAVLLPPRGQGLPPVPGTKPNALREKVTLWLACALFAVCLKYTITAMQENVLIHS